MADEEEVINVVGEGLSSPPPGDAAEDEEAQPWAPATESEERPMTADNGATIGSYESIGHPDFADMQGMEYKHINERRIEKQQKLIMRRMGYSTSEEEVRVVDVHDQEITNVGNLFIKFTNLEVLFAHNNLIHTLGDLFLCPNLVKLDLSGNEISRLPPQDFWRNFQQLKVLYLHDNKIADWRVTTGLYTLPRIRVLTLLNNPVCEHQNYRHFMINMIPTLHRLDDYFVTDEEFIEGADFGPIFRSLREELLAPPPVYSESFYEEPPVTPAVHLEDLQEELRHHRIIYEQNSPVIIIQRMMRGHHTRLFMKLKQQKMIWAIVLMQARMRRWLLRLRMQRELDFLLNEAHDEELLKTENEIVEEGAILKIQMFWRMRCDAGWLRNERCAVVIQYWFKKMLRYMDSMHHKLISGSHDDLLFETQHYDTICEAAEKAVLTTYGKKMSANEARQRTREMMHTTNFVCLTKVTHSEPHITPRPSTPLGFANDGVLRRSLALSRLAASGMEHQIEMTKREIESLERQMDFLLQQMQVEDDLDLLDRKSEWYSKLSEQKQRQEARALDQRERQAEFESHERRIRARKREVVRMDLTRASSSMHMLMGETEHRLHPAIKDASLVKQNAIKRRRCFPRKTWCKLFLHHVNSAEMREHRYQQLKSKALMSFCPPIARTLVRTIRNLKWLKLRKELRKVGKGKPPPKEDEKKKDDDDDDDDDDHRSPSLTEPTDVPILHYGQVEKNAAACTVQSWFRSMISRLSVEPPLLQQVLHRRGATVVQQWWRMQRRFNPRMHYLSALAGIQDIIDDRTLFVDKNLFRLLANPVNLEKKLKALPPWPEHDINFAFNSNDQVRIETDPQKSYDWDHERIGIPHWLSSIRPPEVDLSVAQGPAQRYTKVSMMDMGNLLTRNVEVRPVATTIESLLQKKELGRGINPSQRRFSQIGHGRLQVNQSLEQEVRDKHFHPMNWSARGLHLVSLTFQSVHEARFRLAVLMSRTWDSRRRCFAPIYSESMLRLSWERKFGTAQTMRVAAGMVPSHLHATCPHRAWTDKEEELLRKVHHSIEEIKRKQASIDAERQGLSTPPGALTEKQHAARRKNRTSRGPGWVYLNSESWQGESDAKDYFSNWHRTLEDWWTGRRAETRLRMYGPSHSEVKGHEAGAVSAETHGSIADAVTAQEHTSAAEQKANEKREQERKDKDLPDNLPKSGQSARSGKSHKRPKSAGAALKKPISAASTLPMSARGGGTRAPTKTLSGKPTLDLSKHRSQGVGDPGGGSSRDLGDLAVVGLEEDLRPVRPAGYTWKEQQLSVARERAQDTRFDSLIVASEIHQTEQDLMVDLRHNARYRPAPSRHIEIISLERKEAYIETTRLERVGARVMEQEELAATSPVRKSLREKVKQQREENRQRKEGAKMERQLEVRDSLQMLLRQRAQMEQHALHRVDQEEGRRQALYNKVQAERHKKQRRKAERNFAMSFGQQSMMMARHVAMGNVERQRDSKKAALTSQVDQLRDAAQRKREDVLVALEERFVERRDEAVDLRMQVRDQEQMRAAAKRQQAQRVRVRRAREAKVREMVRRVKEQPLMVSMAEVEQGQQGQEPMPYGYSAPPNMQMQQSQLEFDGDDAGYGASPSWGTGGKFAPSFTGDSMVGGFDRSYAPVSREPTRPASGGFKGTRVNFQRRIQQPQQM